ncbi:MAG: oligoendopeptidase F [Nitrospirales bacterium]|nr:oligoendopeptidase F [Nitrospirales bacterium]
MPSHTTGLTHKPKKTTKHLPQWNLSDLLADPNNYASLFKELDQHVTRFERYRAHLNSGLSVRRFQTILQLHETIRILTSRLAAYAQLWFAQNTTNQKARALDTTMKEQITACNNRMLFFDLWWQRLKPIQATRLMKHAGSVRYYLEILRQLTPHTLTEAEERIVNLKNSTGRDALDMVYDIATNNFSYTLKTGRSTKTLTRETLSQLFRHPAPQTRQAAYQTLFQVYANQKDIIGELYKTIVLDWKNEGTILRGYSSPIAVRNVSNDIPNQAIHSLLQTCQKNTAMFQRYFCLKAKICGISSMNRYHLHATQPTSYTRIPYPDAIKIVLEAYHRFSPTLAEKARRVVTSWHIDARLHSGKVSGAFCYSVLPTLTPYVLVNYTEDARDVATIAHELGHAVHSMMASHHSIFTFHPTLPLAETASVFGEQLLADALLQQANNRRLRQHLLMSQLDNLYATILRQAYFVIFENQAHEMIANGATIDELGKQYLKLLREQFGKAMPIPEEFQWEWLTIPHLFRTPFYCYAYSFGNLLVLALYQRYQEEGDSFVPKYLQLLAAGGSQSPDALLSPLGVNIRSTQFWQAGFDRIEQMVNHLEQTVS